MRPAAFIRRAGIIQKSGDTAEEAGMSRNVMKKATKEADWRNMVEIGQFFWESFTK